MKFGPVAPLFSCASAPLVKSTLSTRLATRPPSWPRDENSKSFADVEQERLQRQLLAERDADYDSSLGTLCRVQVHTDSHVTCIQDLWAVRNSTPSKRRSSILTIKCNLGILGRLSMNKFLLLSRPRNDGVQGSRKRGARNGVCDDSVMESV